MIFNCVIGIWVTAALLLGQCMPAAENLRTTPIAFFHVPMAITMLLGFTLAAWYGVLWLLKRQERYDALSLGFAEAGLAAGVVAMATGMIFSRTNWGAYWSWDPQQVGVLGTLLTYVALFSLRGATEDEEKRRNFWAVYAIIGVMVAMFGSYVFRQILPPNSSLHPSGTLTTSQPIFRLALWFNVFGFAMLMIKLGLLRARFEVVAQKLRRLEARDRPTATVTLTKTPIAGISVADWEPNESRF